MPLFYTYPQMLTDSSEEATGMDTWESDRGPFRKVLHFRFPFLLGIYRGRQLYRLCSIYNRLQGLGPAFLVQTVQHGRHQMVLVHIFSGLGLHDVCYCGTNLVPVCRYTSAVKAFAYVVIHTRSQPGVVGLGQNVVDESSGAVLPSCRCRSFGLFRGSKRIDCMSL